MSYVVTPSLSVPAVPEGGTAVLTLTVTPPSGYVSGVDVFFTDYDSDPA